MMNYQDADRAAGASNYEWKYFSPKDGPKSVLMQVMDTGLADVFKRRGQFEASMVEAMTQTRFLLAGMEDQQREAAARVQARLIDAVFKQVWPGDAAKMHELMAESTALSDMMMNALVESHKQ